jgi:hypothetical protein
MPTRNSKPDPDDLLVAAAYRNRRSRLAIEILNLSGKDVARTGELLRKAELSVPSRELPPMVH